MKRKIIPIGMAALLLGIVFDWFFYNHALGLNLSLFVIALLATTIFLSAEFNRRLPRSVLLLMPVISFFAVMAAILASGMVLFFNTLLILYLLLLSVRLAIRPERLRDFRAADYGRHLLELLPMSIGASKTELGQALSSNKIENGPTSGPIVRGILISLPVVILFALLLSSADLVFQKFLNSLFSFHINSELYSRVLLILVVTSLVGGAYVLLFMRLAAKPDEYEPAARSRLGSTEAAIVLSSVGMLFLAFILIQFTYFFGGSGHVLSTGFTYAEYARRGFFELIAVAVLSLALIWGLRLAVRIDTPSQKRLHRWLSLVLVAEVMVIMLSAHMRLSLYEDTYGFTELRLLSHLVIGWLAVVFILLVAQIVRDEQDHVFAFRLFLSILGFFIVFDVINPAGFIARENVARYQRTHKLDFAYLRTLPEDSTPAIASLLHDNDPVIRKGVAELLFSRQKLTEGTYNHWQSWNLSRSRANNIYRDNAGLLQANRDYTNPDLIEKYR